MGEEEGKGKGEGGGEGGKKEKGRGWGRRSGGEGGDHPFKQLKATLAAALSPRRCITQHSIARAPNGLRSGV